MSTKTIETIRTKEEWLAQIIEQRNRVGDDPGGGVAHVLLYCQKPPTALPGAAAKELFVMMFAGDFYEGPDAAMPIEDFKEAWARIICLNAVAGDAIASVAYQTAWQLDLEPGEDPPEDCSKDPRATKHFLFVTNHRDFGNMSWIARIHEDGDTRTVDPWQDVARIEGRMFDFIQREPPTHRQQVQAAGFLANLGKDG